MKIKPLVSVNIRTYNSGKTLRDTLESIEKQSYKNIEILISDGYSKDNSVAIAKEFKAKVNFADKLGDARYQNYTNSKGKYIFSVDSDQILDGKLIERCVEECETKNKNALIIAEESIIKGTGFLEKLIAYDKWLIHQTKSINPTFGTACPRFFERKLLQEVSWPKGISIFDDTILYAQILENGGKVEYISDQFIRHKEVTSWITFIKKFYRYGKGYLKAFKENPSTIAAHSLPRQSYFSKAALSKPHYFLGLIILYSVKSFSAFLGALSYLITYRFSKE